MLEIEKFRVRKLNDLFSECKEINITELSSDVLLGLKYVLVEYFDKFEKYSSVDLKVTQKEPPYAEYHFTYRGWDCPKTKYNYPGAMEKTWGRLDIQKACKEIEQLARLNTKTIGDYTIKDIEELYEKSCKYVDEYCRQLDGLIPTELENFFVETNRLLQAVLNEK